MALFALRAFLQSISSLMGFWPPLLYRLYYATPPIQPALLALAVLTLYQGGFRRFGKVYGLYITALSIPLVILCSTSPIDLDLIMDTPYVGGLAMDRSVRIFSPPLTIPSGLILLGYPTYKFFKGDRSVDKLLMPLAA